MSPLPPLTPALRALRALDLTDLSDDCRPANVDALLRRAVTPHGPVAAVCVWPQFVSQCIPVLRETGVKVATVINFPAGGTDIARAVGDTREALDDGADEIDLVLPWRAFLAGDETIGRDMIADVRAAIPASHHLKVILETGELSSPDAIARASRLALECGADFIKTSTGKTKVSATPAAAEIMLTAIRENGRAAGFKASGGIRTLADATLYLDIADRIMGPGWATPARFRFGASGLLDALLAALSPPA